MARMLHLSGCVLARDSVRGGEYKESRSKEWWLIAGHWFLS
jgi:hypothetical protein